MSTTTTTEVQTDSNATLKLRSSEAEQKEGEYKYAEYMPTFVNDQYPPLTPFEHVDPAARALSHTNPRAFLDNATKVVEITPFLGSEVLGLDLTSLDSDGRDQLALEVITYHSDVLKLNLNVFVRLLAVVCSSSEISRPS
jgi:sulfonate dioxygenase